MSQSFEDILDEPDEVEAETTTESTATTETVAVDVSGSAESSDPAPVATAEETTAATPAPETPQLPDGYKLDSLGRVHGPDGRVIAKEEAERILAEAKTATAPVQPPAVPPVSETPKAPEGEPYWVRHGGQKVTIPHSIRNPDGSIVIKPEGADQVRDLFTQALAHKQSWPQEKQRYEQRIAQMKAQAEAAPKKYHDASVMMLDRLESPQWRQEFAADPDRAMYYLKRDLDILLREADLKAPKAEPESPQMDEAQLEQAAKAITTEEIDIVLDELGKGLTEQERKDISQAVLDVMPALWVLRDEEPALSLDALKRRVEREVGIVNRVREAASKAAEDARKAREAAAFNAAQASKPVPQSPTKPAPKPVAAVASAPARKDWDTSFKSAWDDDTDDE